MKDLNTYWWLEAVRGVVLILLAILIFTYPINAILGLALYIGISLLLTGIIEVIAALQLKKHFDNWKWGLTVGILEILFAIILLSNPAVTARTIPFIVGLWLMIHGVMLTGYSYQEKKVGFSGWGWNMFLGILTVIFGYLVTFNEVVGVLTITTWMGIGFLMAGIFSIAIAFFFKPKAKKEQS